MRRPAPRLLTSRGWFWLVVAPLALGALAYGLSHGFEPPAKPYFAPWSLIP